MQDTSGVFNTYFLLVEGVDHRDETDVVHILLMKATNARTVDDDTTKYLIVVRPAC
jgi:D-Tyr-tRNAtyr deacylase